MAKQLVFGEDARKSILNGVTILSDAVKATTRAEGKECHS